MRRRQAHQAHNGQLWARLYQLIKVEEPITFEAIRRLCSDVPAHDLTTTLREMCAAKRINVARNWRGPSFIEARHESSSVLTARNGRFQTATRYGPSLTN